VKSALDTYPCSSCLTSQISVTAGNNYTAVFFVMGVKFEHVVHFWVF